ncbi:MBL fold metallo-hydrolase [Paratractidigestivibacter sp.]|uniref:MBL fold metallo-hydrolase n=1 Tax=Paratractidigestivibacter sp. TaxID=2847316 RepID=UPI002AC8E159|nr:MBL fold metallo-hydrolase [Paratractidigestivibacter sp.]
MVRLFAIEEMGPGLWRIGDPLGDLCYLVEGEREAALIDTMAGFGDLAACVRGLVGAKPVRVLLTHRHLDHTSGAYWFDEAWVPAGETSCWDSCDTYGEFMWQHAQEMGAVVSETPYGPRDRTRPATRLVGEGDVFDLGGYTLEAVALPGHTDGSLGYVCPELRTLFSGDAVTPIACLCFPESLPLFTWKETIEKIRRLSIDRFLTGHHRHDFTKDDLDGFLSAADFAADDRGYAWHHGFIPDWEGTLHFAPNGTDDVDSPDFRAVITPGLPVPRKRRRT